MENNYSIFVKKCLKTAISIFFITTIAGCGKVGRLEPPAGAEDVKFPGAYPKDTHDYNRGCSCGRKRK